MRKKLILFSLFLLPFLLQSRTYSSNPYSNDDANYKWTENDLKSFIKEKIGAEYGYDSEEVFYNSCILVKKLLHNASEDPYNFKRINGKKWYSPARTQSYLSDYFFDIFYNNKNRDLLEKCITDPNCKLINFIKEKTIEECSICFYKKKSSNITTLKCHFKHRLCQKCFKQINQCPFCRAPINKSHYTTN